MASSQAENRETGSDLSDIKRKLVKRMGIAALMIVGLLGGLAVFDRLSAPNEADSNNAPQFSEPVPVAKKVQTQPVVPVPPSSEAPKDNKVVAEPESTATPSDKSGAGLGLPPPPEVMPQPVVAPAPVSTSPVANVAGPVISGSGPAKTSKLVRTAEGERSVAPVEAVKPAESSKPVQLARPAEPVKQTRAVEPVEPSVAVAPPALPPTPSRLLSGYALQVGVFADPRRAEELHARLVQEGIPAVIEARVEVGPFKSRQEAEATRAKLGALGIESIMLAPKGAKR
jgi:DedD protein